MKKILFLTIFSLSLLFPFALSTTRAQPSSKTIVYYFHGQFRCYACLRIEELTRKALQKGFQKELSSGSVIFNAVNIDMPVNGHFIKDYRLETRSVVISQVTGSRETAWKHLEKTWDYLGDEKEFLKYIQDEVKNIRSK